MLIGASLQNKDAIVLRLGHHAVHKIIGDCGGHEGILSEIVYHHTHLLQAYNVLVPITRA